MDNVLDKGEPVVKDQVNNDKIRLGELSQKQLVLMRFKRHRLALFSLCVLVLLYFIALFAEFFAPNPKYTRNLDYIYAPPQLPKFNFEHGWHTEAIRMERDPVTFHNRYYAVPGEVVPLSFFVRGEEYTFLGLFEWDRRFFGVDHRALEKGIASPERASFYFLGANRYGEDIFSHIIYGSRISLSVGLVAIFMTSILGILIGGISGYVGGKLDELIQRAIEIVRSFPQIPLWLALGAIIPAEWPVLARYFGITMILSLLGWTTLARAVRGKFLSLREEDYTTSARLLGASHGRIIFRHLVPGFTSHIIVVLTISVPGMILGETSLSFLGLGLRPPVVSWGVMLQDAMQLHAVSNYPWLLMPVLSIIITVISFNFVGDGMRDAADPYSNVS